MAIKDNIFMAHVAPGLGAVVATLMFVSPLRAVLQANRDGHLGELNPTPYPLIMANCGGWIAYSIVTRDIYVFVANQPGFVIGTFFTLVAYRLADPRVRARLAQLTLFFSFALTLVSFVTAKVHMSSTSRTDAWGFTANAILVIFYGSPLSTMLQVVRRRSCASLHWPLSLMSLINGTLWVIYGLAVSDYFIWISNGLGALLGALQLALIWAFPRKPFRSTLLWHRRLLSTALSSRQQFDQAALTQLATDFAKRVIATGDASAAAVGDFIENLVVAVDASLVRLEAASAGFQIPPDSSKQAAHLSAPDARGGGAAVELLAVGNAGRGSELGSGAGDIERGTVAGVGGTSSSGAGDAGHARVRVLSNGAVRPGARLRRNSADNYVSVTEPPL